MLLFRSAPLSSGTSEDKAEDAKGRGDVAGKGPGKEDKWTDPRTKEIKRRVESWLRDSEDDANKVIDRLNSYIGR